MSLEREHAIVHTAHPIELGRWWAKALGWAVVWQSENEYSIRCAPERRPGLTFATVPDAKVAKSRLHLDFHLDDQAVEVNRLVRLGAQRVDIGQGEQPWVVLADPEGNEFCILASKNPPNVDVDALGVAPYEQPGRTRTSPPGDSIRSAALSAPSVATTAVAIYLLSTLWRIAIGETWLIPWQHSFVSASPTFAAFAAVVVIVATAMIYRRLSRHRAASRR